MEGGGFPMSHYEDDQWSLYIRGELSPHMEEQMDSHLYDCEQCLAAYMRSVDTRAHELPLTSRTAIFYNRTLRNYMIASAATLLLVLTGVFHGLSDLPKVNAQQQESSLSEKILDSAVSMIDTLKPKESNMNFKEDNR
jgi:hypothetical protein